MKRLFGLLAVLLMITFGSVQAQSWIGLRSGFPLGVTLHYGVQNGLANGLDFRVSANLRASGDNVSFGVGVDAMNTVFTEAPFNLYVGFGPAVDFNNSGTLIDIHGLLGGEFRFSDVDLDPLGIFAEISLGAGIGVGGRSSEIPSFGGAVGFNYHF